MHALFIALIAPLCANALSTAETARSENALGTDRWRWILDSIVTLESHGRARVAAFDVDGVLIKEKPVLAEVQIPRAAVCAQGGGWPLSLLAKNKICPAHDDEGHVLPLPRLSYEETYDLLLAPFRERPAAHFTRMAADALPRSGLMYAGMSELLFTLHQRGWTILLVSTSMRDFVRAFADVYLQDIPVTILCSSLLGSNVSHSANPRGIAVERIVSGLEKRRIVEEFTLDTYGKEMPALLAIGNTNSDKEMVFAASDAGGLGVMIEHDSSSECAECPYLAWKNFSEAAQHAVQLLRVSDFPRPLFVNMETRKEP